MVAQFDGSYRAWREAVAAGWTAADAVARRSGRPIAPPPVPPTTAVAKPAAISGNGEGTAGVEILAFGTGLALDRR